MKPKNKIYCLDEVFVVKIFHNIFLLANKFQNLGKKKILAQFFKRFEALAQKVKKIRDLEYEFPKYLVLLDTWYLLPGKMREMKNLSEFLFRLYLVIIV